MPSGLLRGLIIVLNFHITHIHTLMNRCIVTIGILPFGLSHLQSWFPTEIFTVLAEIQSLIHARPPHSLLPPDLSAALPAPPAGSAYRDVTRALRRRTPALGLAPAGLGLPPAKWPGPVRAALPAWLREAGQGSGEPSWDSGKQGCPWQAAAGGQRGGALAAPASGCCGFKAAS